MSLPVQEKIMSKVKVLVLRTAGTNCDLETAFAFESFGAQADRVHIKQLSSDEVSLENYHILAIPGGFSYGDDIESGRILANELRIHLKKDIDNFIRSKKLIIGICNGFQILVKAGILPGLSKNGQEATLTHNDSGKFEDRWVHLKVEGQSVWTDELDEVVFYPVAHAEGKFLADAGLIKDLSEKKQVVFRYVNPDGSKPDYPADPNGSLNQIAGICDPTGHVLGLMPHPERHFLFQHHPYWTRLDKKEKYGQGAKIFENGVNYIKQNFLK